MSSSELCRVCMLGQLSLDNGQLQITRFRTHKTGALLAYLAHHMRAPHSREYLIEMLWPESDIDAGRQSLSTALSALRRQLEPPGVEPESVLLADRMEIRLVPGSVWTDVAEFESLQESLRSALSECERLEAAKGAVQLYCGPLLPGFDDSWVVLERERLQEEFCSTLKLAAHLYQDLGDLKSAIAIARRAVSADPLLEDNYHLLIQLYEAAGDPTAAARVRAQWDDAVEQAFAPETPSSPRRASGVKKRQNGHGSSTENNRRPVVPHYGSRFFGREDEIARVLASLANPSQRVTTLLGPGGIGKTRLAVEVAKRHLNTDRLLFLPLADLVKPSRLPTEVANGLGLPSSSSATVRQLSELLSETPTLLILDNFEHLTEMAPWVLRLAATTLNLQILMTSRRSLGIKGEDVIELGPLSLPIFDDELTALAKDPTIALFVDRAQKTRPDFQLTPRNGLAVQQLCLGLEGIPLAIELAAARSQILTPAQMLSQLENRFSFLVNKKRSMTERHRTMSAAIQWSVDLLSTEAQGFFPKLGIFRGGWTHDSVDKVLGESRSRELLRELLQAGLIRSEGVGGQMRYSMPETVRAFGSSRLTQEVRIDLCRQHAEFFLSLAEEAAPHLRAPDFETWLAKLKSEEENCRAALEFSLEHEYLLGMRLAVALSPYWDLQANMSENRQWLEEFLRKEDPYPSPLRMAALFGGGALCFVGGSLLRAKDYLEECLRFAESLGDESFKANALEALGLTLASLQEPGAVDCFERGMEIASQTGDDLLASRMLFLRGLIAQVESNLDLAHDCFERGLAFAEKTPPPFMVGRILAAWGTTFNMKGQPDKAEELFVRAQEIAQNLGDFFIVSLCDWGRSIVEYKRGNLGQARALNREHVRGLELHGSAWGGPHYLECQSRIELSDGHEERAVTLLAASIALRESTHVPFVKASKHVYDDLLNRIEALKATPEYASAWSRGFSMTWEQAVEFALAEDSVQAAAAVQGPTAALAPAV